MKNTTTKCTTNWTRQKDFPVVDGFFSFTRTFRYLGSLIFYNLHDNNNITARIAAANASMGALKDLWRNPHLDMYSKYLVFKAISMNLLLWGVETWSLQKLQLDTFEVFLHRSIWRIISTKKVQEQRLHNSKVGDMFYSIPCVRNMIAAGQMDFVGRMTIGPLDRPSCNMIMVCCDHNRWVGRPQAMGKNFMVKNVCLLFQDIPTIHIDRYGFLCSWIHESSDKKYWCQLVDQLLYPDTLVPERPADWGPLPSRQACRAANGPAPTGDTSDSNNERATDDDE